MTESRWTSEFAQHPLHQTWQALREFVSVAVVDDQTVTTSVLELSRLKRVVAYIDEILLSIDPELAPRSTWPVFHQQAEAARAQVEAYNSNKNIGHIANANENVDNLLTYVRPYMVAPADAVKALNRSSKTLGSELQKFMTDARAQSQDILTSMRRNGEQLAKRVEAADADGDRIHTYVAELFDGSDASEPTQKRISKLIEDAETMATDITALHTTLVAGAPDVPSTRTSVKLVEAEIESTRAKTAGLLGDAQAELTQLGVFHEKIFGKLDDATGQPTGGLELELNTRAAQLKKLEDEQVVKHRAISEQIESLLPGATSAGLASAYKTLRDEFTSPIRTYTRLFYGSLIGLVVAALVMAVKLVSVYPTLSIQFVDVPDWDVIFKALIYKAPFIAPVVWLALFSSIRRSQYERLQQEYAHKEALARSYESYKKQIAELKGDGDALQRELIAKAIEAIAFNASSTLDGKHEDSTPLQKFIEKNLSIDDVKKLVESLKGEKPK